MPFREWVVRFLGSLRPRRDDADLEEELRLHLELAAEDASRQSNERADARRTAVLSHGSITQAVDALRDQRGLPWIDGLKQDVRYALRSLRRSPVFSAVIILSLALGLGANSALFSLVDATLLRDLPVEAPGDLVQFHWRSKDWFPESERFAGSGSIGAFGRRSPTFTSDAFEALRRHRSPLSDVFAFSVVTGVNAAANRQADDTTMLMVSGNYFSGLKVEPAIGRLFTDADDGMSSETAAVISERIWKRRFDRKPEAIGSTVMLDTVPFTIIGVAPSEFRGAVPGVPKSPDFWVPLALAPRFGLRHAEQRFWWLSVMGRLQPGATLDQVRGSLEGTFRAAVRETDTPPALDVPELRITPARRGANEEGPDDELEHAIILGVIFCGLLLLVCLNVANLMLSRSAGRRAEIGVRLALGASRGRLVRQLLTESVILAVTGGVIGLVLAWWGRAFFAASGFVPQDLPLTFGGPLFVVTMLLSGLAGVLFGLAPAIRATRIYRHASTKVEITASPSSRLNRMLLATQVAVSVVLLFGAGLFVRTLGNWNSLDPGFDAENLLIFQIKPGALGYDEARAAELRERLASRLRAVPGVLATTTSGSIWKPRWFGRFLIDGKSRRPIPYWLPVRHDFFATMGLPLLAGRAFLPEEDARPPDVAVVDENMARLFYGGVSPIGQRFAFRAGAREVTIVGVVGNMTLPGTRPEEVAPRIYLPERASRSHFEPDAGAEARYRIQHETSVAIRTAADPAAIQPAIRDAVREVDPNLPVIEPKTAVQGMRDILEPTRIVSFIWLSFAIAAVALTAIGLYGLLANSIVQRTREIGIRTALGARKSDIVRLVTAQSAIVVAIGLTAGLAASAAVTQLVRAHTFGVTSYDLPTVAGVVGLVMMVASLAAFVPARRAANVDASVALRHE